MKKYKVGYVAGVFDLFHIGHLNLLRNAKQECEHLIVGVLTDDEVLRWKPSAPFIPFEERIEIVKAIKYVDETIKVTSDNIGRLESWNQLHFDCQFSGDDYSESWAEEQKKLRSVGSDIVFFPYTKSTSSTHIKNLIRKSLV